MENQNSIQNNEEGVQLYEILYSNLPTIDAGGPVTEEMIWKCVNEIIALRPSLLEIKTKN